MIYTIWNTTSDIDGRTPEYIIGNNPAYGVEKTYILRENDETLVDILTISMIRAGDETSRARRRRKTRSPPSPPKTRSSAPRYRR